MSMRSAWLSATALVLLAAGGVRAEEKVPVLVAREKVPIGTYLQEPERYFELAAVPVGAAPAGREVNAEACQAVAAGVPGSRRRGRHSGAGRGQARPHPGTRPRDASPRHQGECEILGGWLCPAWKSGRCAGER